MPSVSKAQQAIMGMALAYNRGDLEDVSTTVKDLADSMSIKDLEDYASTCTKGLPDKIDDSLQVPITREIETNWKTDPKDVGKQNESKRTVLTFDEFKEQEKS